MVKLLEAKVGSLSIMDALGVALLKSTEERLLAPVVGNASLMSGAIKVGLALVSGGVIKNKFGNLLGTALIVDGTEDIVTAFFGGGGGIVPVGQGGSMLV